VHALCGTRCLTLKQNIFLSSVKNRMQERTSGTDRQDVSGGGRGQLAEQETK
jgi:hypothetical protein